MLDNGSLTALQKYARPANRRLWADAVNEYLGELRGAGWVVLPGRPAGGRAALNHGITLLADPKRPPSPAGAADRTIDPATTVAAPPDDDVPGPPAGDGHGGVPAAVRRTCWR